MSKFFYKLKILILRIISYEKPYRVGLIKLLSLKYKSFRPHYETVLYESVREAKKLGYKKLCVLELGVAGGNGMIALESCKKKIEKVFDVEINVYGFDTGNGMPDSKDVADARFNWKKGDYNMNQKELKSKINGKLYLGLIDETIKDFIKDNSSYICAIFFDMDYYSSTKSFLNKIPEIKNMLLPRVLCYFDDLYTPNNYMGKFIGEYKAITEFNNENSNQKLMKSLDHISDYKFPLAKGSLFSLHTFDHKLYNDFIGEDDASVTNLGNRKTPDIF